MGKSRLAHKDETKSKSNKLETTQPEIEIIRKFSLSIKFPILFLK